MGRIKTKLVKRITKRLMREHSDKFKNDFLHNKAIVSKYIEVSSLKIRNIIAGYVTRLKQKGYNPEEAFGFTSPHTEDEEPAIKQKIAG